MSIWLAAVISTIHLEGPITADGGAYLMVPFEVPADTVEIRIAHRDGSDAVILDWGVWSPEGFRGYGGGLTDDAVIGVAESSRGYLAGPITPGPWALLVGKARLAGGAASYVVDVTFDDAATLTPGPRAPYDPVVLAEGGRWYAGDLHVHSEESGDASATLAAIATLARDRGLDFVVITDHNTTSHHPRLAAAQPGLDDLLLVRGIEVTTYAGHGNAIGVAAPVDWRIGVDGVSATTIAAAVAAQDAVFSVNHPTLDLGDTCIGCAWAHPDTPWAQVAALEIHTGPFDVSGLLFTPQAIALWDALLDDGHRLAAVGGSDDHRADAAASGTQSPVGSPTTLVWADQLGEAAIVAGIRAGRTMVKLRGPGDPTVELTAVTADGGAAQIGDTVSGVGRARLTVRVTGAPPGSAAEVWRDGVRVDNLAIDGADWTGELDYPVTGALERYRVEVVGGVGRMTVTSHLWVDGDPALDSGAGCGCAAGGAAGRQAGAMVPLTVAALALRRRRRRAKELRHVPARQVRDG